MGRSQERLALEFLASQKAAGETPVEIARGGVAVVAVIEGL